MECVLIKTTFIIFILIFTNSYATDDQSADFIKDSTIELGPFCQPELIRCSCGQDKDNKRQVTTFLKSCMDKKSMSCQLCEEVHPAGICSNYANCQTCGDGLDRCLTCPQHKYGQWCDRECPCKNDGACDQTGLCVCRHGYTGHHCETMISANLFDNDAGFYPSTTDPSNAKPLRRIIRQAEDRGECQMITNLENGMAQIDTFKPKVGTAVKYSCTENFTLIGSRTRYCLTTGLWSGETPSCERLCPFPITSLYLNVKINPNRIGPPLYDSFNNEILSELEFNCSNGFALNGARIVRCAGGVWDHPIPTCDIQPICQNPEDLVHGNRQFVGEIPGNAQRLGTQIIYTCDNGYTLVGKNISTCTAYGTWSSSVPTCVPNVVSRCSFTCRTPAGGQNGFYELKDALKCKIGLQNDEFVLVPDAS